MDHYSQQAGTPTTGSEITNILAIPNILFILCIISPDTQNSARGI